MAGRESGWILYWTRIDSGNRGFRTPNREESVRGGAVASAGKGGWLVQKIRGEGGWAERWRPSDLFLVINEGGSSGTKIGQGVRGGGGTRKIVLLSSARGNSRTRLGKNNCEAS